MSYMDVHGSKMIKAVYSDKYAAKMARIKRLPTIMERVMSAQRRKDALALIKTFHDCIKDNELGLERLAETSKSAKRRKGYERPDSPLYGKGDKEPKKSYSNMLRLRKVNKGWTVFASWGKHWDADMKLRDLLKLHEEGGTFKSGKGMIRIPPRPAFWLSYRKVMMVIQSDLKEQSREVKRAINEYINKADMKRFDKVLEVEKKGKDKESE